MPTIGWAIVVSGLMGAIAFLTRVPVRGRAGHTTAGMVPWFGVAGALIGAAVGGVVVGVGELTPPSAGAAVGIVFGILLTGCFHEDGLADVADAFAGGWSVEDRLRILKDPLHGSYGVAALCATIVVRVTAVAALPPAAALAALVSAHALGRAAPVGLMLTLPTASSSGLGVRSTEDLPRARCLLGIAAAVALAALATGWWALPFTAAAALAAGAVGWLAMRKIRGITGDVLGAAEQVAECTILVVAAGLATHHPLWWP